LPFLFVSCLGGGNNDSRASLTRAAIIAQDIIKNKFCNDCEFDTYDIRGEECDVKDRYKVLQQFTSSKYGCPQKYVYKIYIQYYGGDWADVNNWDYGQLVIENVSTGKQEYFHGTMKNREKEVSGNGKTIEISGVKFEIVENNNNFIRLANDNKLSRNQLKNAILELKDKYNSIYFCVKPNTDRGKEYAAFIFNTFYDYDNGETFLFEKL
jgi:hypothetical protein